MIIRDCSNIFIISVFQAPRTSGAGGGEVQHSQVQRLLSKAANGSLYQQENRIFGTIYKDGFYVFNS